ncbi:MAG: non-homologous end-joining DNA ligase [bacterium]|nr:non-homologous end-joining DNA ligase [bacterium]
MATKGSLAVYRKKRDFSQTPEPRGAQQRGRGAAPRFVVQMHRATQLHYDFRLEIDGVLASWAVPKGPSLDPSVKRLAMRTEDHPLDYYDFEGRIPEGNYGAGEVIVWDAGTFELLEGDSPQRGLAHGSLKFRLQGKKLRGGFALVKMHARNGEEKAWLLIKERDADADRRWRATAHPDSVISGKTLAQIAAAPKGHTRTWTSSRSDSRPESGESPPVTNPDRVLWPQDGITKGDLIAYYDRIAPRMLPYLEDRPLTLQRFPQGIEAQSFFEKNAPRGAPAWLRTVAIHSESTRRDIRYVICNDRRTLLYLANLAAIVLHVWQSRTAALERPDILLFDLDPTDGCSLRTLSRVAVAIRDELSSIGLRSRVKTTGASGLHVIVALRDAYVYDDVRRFAQLLAQRLADARPGEITLQRTVDMRPRGAVYLDYVQVGEGKTMVAPYSARPHPGAPISMPLEWAQVEAWTSSRVRTPLTAFARWSMDNAADESDPWRGSYGIPQRLEAALKRAQRLWKEDE